ncbi:MAG TPA: MATE family efflux transporter, partial [Labilithrix sp.]
MTLAKEVRRLALPAILHSLLQTLVFVVDRIMLGRHGEASLAAMQVGGALEWSLWSVFAAFEVGTIARVGRHVGARAPAMARRAAWLSLGMAVAIGGVVALATPLVLAVLPFAMRTASPAALAEAQRYLGVTIAASPLVFVAMTSIAALQAGGDTRTPLAIGIAANVVHVALNRALILGVGDAVPALGARGAGISTAVTFALEAVLATAALAGTSRPVSLRKREGEAEPGDDVRAEARTLARVALPAFLERLLYHVGFVGYVVIIARLGDATMAANQALISVESIC